ncbi:alpha-galactosidase [Neolewinella sp.]|uniref:alpha-galactosidase n=1 Tax=Neolewinella sp. TaxID=2993543 RepID=UPI003B52710F
MHRRTLVKSLLLVFLVLATLQLPASDTLLVLDNGTGRFELQTRQGRVYLHRITDLRYDRTLTFDTSQSLFDWPEEATVRLEKTEQQRIPATAYRSAHTLLRLTQTSGADTLERTFRLFDGVVALQGGQQLMGATEQQNVSAPTDANGVEKAAQAGGVPMAIGSAAFNIRLPGRHWQLTTVRFTDQTDGHNDLVQRDEHLLFNGTTRTRGNLLIARSTLTDEGLWLLREAPLGESQLDDAGYDFAFSFDRLSVAGHRYGFSIGLCTRDPALESLRAYQLASYRYLAERDEMVLMNTWGDRGQDGKVNEDFVLRELGIAAALGITHFQIDDGWQAGLSKNSASTAGDRWGYWETEDWVPHPERFPHGLTPVVERARELGMEIGLWFNASRENDYAAWQRDAAILIGLYEDYGIRTFKMDGVDLPTAQSDRNFRRLLDAVRAGTDGRVVFNLDVTAGQRGGYFYLTDYGNVFLENRYTDWGKYYPHWTLRNLWQLAHYLPPARLQIELLNPRRNLGKYPPGDPLAPATYDLAYLFATTAVAQPLAWMEGSNLSLEDQRDSIIHQFHPYLQDLHTGITLPIGEEPDGTAWTGFRTQTSDSTGLLLVFREYNERESARVAMGLPPGREVTLQPLIGHGTKATLMVSLAGELSLTLPQPRSFALYRYTFR